MGQVAALAKPHRTGSIPFDRMIQQAIETRPLTPKQ